MTPDDESKLAYPGWRVAGSSAVGVFVSFASLLVYTFGIFLKPFSTQFGWSREAVSVAFGIAAMTVGVVSPVLGYWFDRVDPRRIIVPSLVVFGVGFASLSLLTPSLWHLYAVFFVLGIVGNGTAQMAYSRAVSSWFVERRGMALAIVMAGGAIGSMVLPPITVMLVGRVGWRAACALLGTMVLVVGLPVVVAFVRQRPTNDRIDPNERAASVREGLASRVFWSLVAVLFLQFRGAERRAHPHGGAAHRPGRLLDVGRSRSVRDGRRKSVRQADYWMAPRSLFRGAGLVRDALAGGGGHVHPRDCGHHVHRCHGGRAHRSWHGR
jgi:MFS family permease